MERGVGSGVQPSLHDLARAVLEEQLGEGRVAEGRGDVQKGAVTRCHCVHRLDADLGGVGKASFEDEAELFGSLPPFGYAPRAVGRFPRGFMDGTEDSLRVLEPSAIVYEETDHVVRVPFRECRGECSRARRFDDARVLGEEGFHAFKVGCVVALTVYDSRFDELLLDGGHVSAFLARPVEVLDGLPDPFDALFAGGFLSLWGHGSAPEKVESIGCGLPDPYVSQVTPEADLSPVVSNSVIATP